MAIIGSCCNVAATLNFPANGFESALVKHHWWSNQEAIDGWPAPKFKKGECMFSKLWHETHSLLLVFFLIQFNGTAAKLGFSVFCSKKQLLIDDHNNKCLITCRNPSLMTGTVGAVALVGGRTYQEMHGTQSQWLRLWRTNASTWNCHQALITWDCVLLLYINTKIDQFHQHSNFKKDVISLKVLKFLFLKFKYFFLNI